MATLGSLVVSLECNMVRFIEAMTKAEMEATRRADAIQRALGGIKNSLVGLGAAVGVGLSFNELWSSFSGVLADESRLVKMADRLGTTTEDLSALGIMAKKTGMDTESFYLALARMERNISSAQLKTTELTGAVDETGEPLAKGAQALDELGLKADVLAKLPLPVQLKAIAQAMAENIAPADRVRIAFQLFGRGGVGMVGALKAGPAAMDEWVRKAQASGMVISTDMAQRAYEAQEAGEHLATSWHRFAVELTDSVAPAATRAADKLTDLLAASRKDIIPAVPHQDLSYGQQLAVNFRDAASPANMVSGLVKEISDNLNSVYNMAHNVNMEFVKWADAPIKKAINEAVVIAEDFWNKTKAISNILLNATFWKWNIDAAGAKSDIQWLHDKIQEVYNLISKPVTWVINTIYNGAQPQGAGRITENQLSDFPPVPVPSNVFKPPPRPAPTLGAGHGGSSGAEAEARRLVSLYDTLTKDISRLSQGSFAEINANLQRTLDQVHKKEETPQVSTSQLEVLAYKRATLEKEKIEKDFNLMVAKESGDRFAEIHDQYNKDLQFYQGIANAKAALDKISAFKSLEAREGIEKEVEGIQKGSLQTIGQASPFLTQQLAIERQLLEVAIQRAHADLEMQLARLPISAELKDDLRSMQALADQAQRFELARKAWADEGMAGGLKSWALETSQQTSGANVAKDLMGTLQSTMSSSLSRGLIAALEGTKGSFLKLGQELAQTFITKATDIGVSQLFGKLAGAIFGKTAQETAITANTDALKALTAALAGKAAGGGTGSFGVGAGYAPSAGAGVASAADLVKGLASNTEAVMGGTAGTALHLVQLTASTIATLAQTPATIANTAALIANLFKPSVAGTTFHGGGAIVAHGGWPSHGATHHTSRYSWIHHSTHRYHQGGPVYAHGGLALDEVPIIAQTGERVLSREQNRDYEAGMGGGGDSHYHHIDNSRYSFPPGAGVGDFKKALAQHREELLKTVQGLIRRGRRL